MTIPLTASDLATVAHASVADEGDPGRADTSPADLMRSAGGGVGRSEAVARIAAIAESLERYAASTVAIETRLQSEVAASGERVLGLDAFSLHHADQIAHPAFPNRPAYPDDPLLTPMHDMADNGVVWVPAVLVPLRREFGGLATSSGLAADFSAHRALLRAAQELVERDAYVVTWLHGLAPTRVNAPRLDAEVAAVGGAVAAFDITPEYSPHPVACVAGTMPLRGRPRHSLGLACRASWEEAVEKAFLEFTQGTMFVGHHLAAHPELAALEPATCTGFDEHAVYWTVHADQWAELPLHRGESGPPPPSSAAASVDDRLEELVRQLGRHGVDLFYRRLPAAGLGQIGLEVMRVVSPQLAPLHHDHNWPFLGGATADLSRRYPGANSSTDFPSPHPHALG